MQFSRESYIKPLWFIANSLLSEPDFQHNDKSEYELTPDNPHNTNYEQLLLRLNKLWFPIKINVSTYFKQRQTPCHYVYLVYVWRKCANILHACKYYSSWNGTTSTERFQSDKPCEEHYQTSAAVDGRAIQASMLSPHERQLDCIWKCFIFFYFRYVNISSKENCDNFSICCCFCGIAFIILIESKCLCRRKVPPRTIDANGK